jgi:preprotein translocase subunit Sec61beta
VTVIAYTQTTLRVWISVFVAIDKTGLGQGCRPGAVLPDETGHPQTHVETVIISGSEAEHMSSQEPGSGLMSSAGLVRYFDSDDNKGMRIDPKSLVAFSVLLGVFVLLLNAFGA